MNTMSKRNKILSISLSTLLAFLFIFPIYILFINSFKSRKAIFTDILALPFFNKDIFTLENYPNAWDIMNFFKVFTNSAIISSISTVIIIVFSSITAWVLVRKKGKLSTGVYNMFAMSILIPFQCVMLPLVRQMTNLNLLNPLGLIIAYLGFGTALGVILFHGFLKNIPIELEEAAIIDGCSNITVFFRIVLPLLKPIIFTVAVLDVMWIWNDYLLPSLLINSNPDWHTIPLATFLFFGQFTKRWDLGTAALMMSMVPIIIFYLFTQKYIIKGITDGAIK